MRETKILQFRVENLKLILRKSYLEVKLEEIDEVKGGEPSIGVGINYAMSTYFPNWAVVQIDTSTIKDFGFVFILIEKQEY